MSERVKLVEGRRKRIRLRWWKEDEGSVVEKDGIIGEEKRERMQNQDRGGGGEGRRGGGEAEV